MKTWVRHSLNVSALTAGALLASGAAAHAQPTMLSTDNVGLLNGTQALVPIQAPVNVCGNAVAVAGLAGAGCEGGARADDEDRHKGKEHGGYDYHEPAAAPAVASPAEVVATSAGAPTMLTSGNLGILNGTQALVPIQIPINVCGNAIAVLGAATAGCEGGATAS